MQVETNNFINEHFKLYVCSGRELNQYMQYNCSIIKKTQFYLLILFAPKIHNHFELYRIYVPGFTKKQDAIAHFNRFKVILDTDHYIQNTLNICDFHPFEYIANANYKKIKQNQDELILSTSLEKFWRLDR